MKRNLVRITCMLLMIALLFTLIPAPAFAASNNSEFLLRYTGSSNSLVDTLKSVGAQSSYEYRCRIAAANNITKYCGSAEQNIYILGILEAGQLKNPILTPTIVMLPREIESFRQGLSGVCSKSLTRHCTL